MRAWSRVSCALLGVRVQVEGVPPAAPGMLVSNHLGYLDILVLARTVPAVFVAKSEIRSWPVLGTLSAQFGTLFIERARKRSIPEVNDRVRQAVAAGDLVTVFPEGTSTRGDAVLPFRPSLLAPAADGKLPVWTATLTYATAPPDPPASRAVCWWGDMTFGPHVLQLFGLSGIDARVTFSPEAVQNEDRKELARTLWEQVRGVFTPVR